MDYATAVAGQVAAGIAQAQHVESVARLAYTDPLTGLANRRAIDDRLDAALDRHRRDGTVVSLVVVDVNGLKRINDDRGHEAGDRALVHFAGLLAASAGLLPGSLAGRSGGDEFCVVVEGSTSDHVAWLAEDLCRRANAALDEGIACGVASTDDPLGPVATPSRLFRLADAAQSRAKRSRARHPVVAGRGLPQDATVRLADAAEQMPRSQSPRGDRRRVRSRRGFSYLLDDVLETLDHSDAVGTQERLEVVADAVCRLVDGCSWWVSRTDASHTVLQTDQLLRDPVRRRPRRRPGGLQRGHVHVRPRRLPAEPSHAGRARRRGRGRRPAGGPVRAGDPRGRRLHGAGDGRWHRRRPARAGWSRSTSTTSRGTSPRSRRPCEP